MTKSFQLHTYLLEKGFEEIKDFSLSPYQKGYRHESILLSLVTFPQLGINLDMEYEWRIENEGDWPYCSKPLENLQQYEDLILMIDAVADPSKAPLLAGVPGAAALLKGDSDGHTICVKD